MNSFVGALSGVLFALGLTLGGMTSPSRVIGFLDVLGAWDPRLAFVMGGAVGTYAVLYRLIRGHVKRPLLGARFVVPPSGKPTARLVLGSALFGVGWGLVGLCPGPTLVALGAGKPEALAFAVAMCAGLVIASVLLRQPASPIQRPRALAHDDA